MKKYFVYFIAIVFLMIPSVKAADFEITGQQAILYNLNDDSVIYEKDANQKVSIASLTKIMTVIVAIENIDDVNDKVIITNNDFIGTEWYSMAGFKVGEQVTYLDLLYGVLLPSGAEAVNALVNNTLKERFVEEMNNTAKRLGLLNTSFSNCIGKDEELNYSTAADVATILKYALENETFKEIFTTRDYKTTNGIQLKSTLINYSQGLDISKIKGAKSGFTDAAGRCLASIANINDVDYLLVVINSNTKNVFSAVLDTLTIYNYYSSNYSYQTILKKGDFIKSLPVKYAKEKQYDILANDTINFYLKNDEKENLRYVYEGVEEIGYKTNVNSSLGV